MGVFVHRHIYVFVFTYKYLYVYIFNFLALLRHQSKVFNLQHFFSDDKTIEKTSLISCF